MQATCPLDYDEHLCFHQNLMGKRPTWKLTLTHPTHDSFALLPPPKDGCDLHHVILASLALTPFWEMTCGVAHLLQHWPHVDFFWEYMYKMARTMGTTTTTTIILLLYIGSIDSPWIPWRGCPLVVELFFNNRFVRLVK